MKHGSNSSACVEAFRQGIPTQAHSFASWEIVEDMTNQNRNWIRVPATTKQAPQCRCIESMFFLITPLKSKGLKWRSLCITS
jgi:hypothetical protein